MYMFFEDDVTGTVCINKTGDTTNTLQTMIQGGKLTTDREAVIAEVTKCIDGVWYLSLHLLHWPVGSGHHAVYSWAIPISASHLSLF